MEKNQEEFVTYYAVSSWEELKWSAYYSTVKNLETSSYKHEKTQDS